jgi:hypothetical protein
MAESFEADAFFCKQIYAKFQKEAGVLCDLDLYRGYSEVSCSTFTVLIV